MPLKNPEHIILLQILLVILHNYKEFKERDSLDLHKYLLLTNPGQLLGSRDYIWRHGHTPPYVSASSFHYLTPTVEFSPLNAVKSNLLQGAGIPSTSPGCSEPVQPDPECLQGQGIHHLSGPVPLPHHPHNKKVSSLIPKIWEYLPTFNHCFPKNHPVWMLINSWMQQSQKVA